MKCPNCDCKLFPDSAGYYPTLCKYGVAYRCKNASCESKKIGYSTEIIIEHDPPQQTILEYTIVFIDKNTNKSLYIDGHQKITSLKTTSKFYSSSNAINYPIPISNGYMPNGGSVTISSGTAAPAYGSGGNIVIHGGTSPYFDEKVLVEIPFYNLSIENFDNDVQKLYNKLKNLVVFS